MNDAEAEIQTARVRRFIDKWMSAGFEFWNLEFAYDRSYSDSMESDRQSVATCSERWEYRQACIRFFLPTVKDQSDEELERHVLHEFCHLLIGSIRDYSTEDRRQMTEFAVSSITQALLLAHRNVKDAAMPEAPIVSFPG